MSKDDDSGFKLGRPAEGSGTPEDLQPGEVAFGRMGREWLVRICPDGTVVFGQEYTPDLAAAEFWKALAARHPNVALRQETDEEHARRVFTEAMETLLVRVGKADLRNEAMQFAANREQATEHDRFQAQLALSNLEVLVHQVIEYARGLALRERGRD